MSTTTSAAPIIAWLPAKVPLLHPHSTTATTNFSAGTHSYVALTASAKRGNHLERWSRAKNVAKIEGSPLDCPRNKLILKVNGFESLAASTISRYGAALIDVAAPRFRGASIPARSTPDTAHARPLCGQSIARDAWPRQDGRPPRELQAR